MIAKNADDDDDNNNGEVFCHRHNDCYLGRRLYYEDSAKTIYRKLNGNVTAPVFEPPPESKARRRIRREIMHGAAGNNAHTLWNVDLPGHVRMCVEFPTFMPHRRNVLNDSLSLTICLFLSPSHSRFPSQCPTFSWVAFGCDHRPHNVGAAYFTA